MRRQRFCIRPGSGCHFKGNKFPALLSGPGRTWVPLGGSNSAVYKRFDSISDPRFLGRPSRDKEGPRYYAAPDRGAVSGGEGSGRGCYLVGSLGTVTPKEPQPTMNVRGVSCTPHPSTRTLGA